MANYIPGVGFIPRSHLQMMWDMPLVSADAIYDAYYNLNHGTRIVELIFGGAIIDRGLLLARNVSDIDTKPFKEYHRRTTAEDFDIAQKCKLALIRMGQIFDESGVYHSQMDGTGYHSIVTPTLSGQYRMTRPGIEILKDPLELAELKENFKKLEAMYAEYRSLWMWVYTNCNIAVMMNYKQSPHIEMPHEEVLRALAYAEYANLQGLGKANWYSKESYPIVKGLGFAR